MTSTCAMSSNQWTSNCMVGVQTQLLRRVNQLALTLSQHKSKCRCQSQFLWCVACAPVDSQNCLSITDTQQTQHAWLKTQLLSRVFITTLTY